MNNEIIKVDNISKSFNLSAKQRKARKISEKTITAVDHISFSAYEGEIFGLLGPNGAGKTTTLRILATILKPDSGNAYINGKSVVDAPFDVRRQIGFLTSEVKMEEFFTPDQLFGFFSEMHGIPEEKCEERKNALFELFGIDKFAQTKVADLSTGMKQKVSLVIAVAHDPKVVIFDEPTNGLDVIMAKVVTDFLLELRRQGKTIIISTHIFSLIEKLCDRVGIINNGKMVVCDSLSKLTEKESLEELFFRLYEGGEVS